MERTADDHISSFHLPPHVGRQATGRQRLLSVSLSMRVLSKSHGVRKSFGCALVSLNGGQKSLRMLRDIGVFPLLRMVRSLPPLDVNCR